MLRVSSEIGRLRQGLIHEPGAEVDCMVPAMMEQLLFDDILYGDRARDEHGRFRRVLQLFGIELIEANELLRETLEQEAARSWILEVLLEHLPKKLRDRLQEASPTEMANSLVAGLRRESSQGGVEAEDLFDLPPLPNWCFQRDTQIVLGDGVIFSSMAAAARHRESLLARASFTHHPKLSSVPVVFDPLEIGGDRRLAVAPERPHLEGGDVLVLSEDVVAVGMSERTNRTGIRALASALSRLAGGPRWLVVVEVPRRRAYMHLDTLITQVDRDACLVFEPVIMAGGSDEAKVSEVDLQAAELSRRPCGPLLDCLRTHGLDLEPIRCGGPDLVTQHREQWTDGANALALAPGVITLYDRNLATADELDRHGFRIVEAEQLLLGRAEVDIESCGRTCILIPSHEMSRARGGPHCLLHALERDPLL